MVVGDADGADVPESSTSAHSSAAHVIMALNSCPCGPVRCVSLMSWGKLLRSTSSLKQPASTTHDKISGPQCCCTQLKAVVSDVVVDDVDVVVSVVASLTIGTPLGRVGVRDGAAVGNGTGAGAVGAVGDWVGENVGADVVTGTGTGVMVGVNVGVAVGVMVGGGLGDGVGDTGAGVGRAVGTAVGVALGALILVHSTVTVAVPVSVLVNRPSSTVWHPTSNATEHCESSALAEPAHKPLWSSFTHGCRMLVSKSVPP
mmetsp:Transcript_31784/g.95522  ORF Transcript_31784/g.95522 Transcript_31784/m.95522 type:complete len:258 (+) Transcript_31784:726-1499(+)